MMRYFLNLVFVYILLITFVTEVNASITKLRTPSNTSHVPKYKQTSLFQRSTSSHENVNPFKDESEMREKRWPLVRQFMSLLQHGYLNKTLLSAPTSTSLLSALSSVDLGNKIANVFLKPSVQLNFSFDVLSSMYDSKDALLNKSSSISSKLKLSFPPLKPFLVNDMQPSFSDSLPVFVIGDESGLVTNQLGKVLQNFTFLSFCNSLNLPITSSLSNVWRLGGTFSSLFNKILSYRISSSLLILLDIETFATASPILPIEFEELLGSVLSLSRYILLPSALPDIDFFKYWSSIESLVDSSAKRVHKVATLRQIPNGVSSGSMYNPGLFSSETTYKVNQNGLLLVAIQSQEEWKFERALNMISANILKETLISNTIRINNRKFQFNGLWLDVINPSSYDVQVGTPLQFIQEFEVSSCDRKRIAEDVMNIRAPLSLINHGGIDNGFLPSSKLVVLHGSIFAVGSTIDVLDNSEDTLSIPSTASPAPPPSSMFARQNGSKSPAAAAISAASSPKVEKVSPSATTTPTSKSIKKNDAPIRSKQSVTPSPEYVSPLNEDDSVSEENAEGITNDVTQESNVAEQLEDEEEVIDDEEEESVSIPSPSPEKNRFRGRKLLAVSERKYSTRWNDIRPIFHFEQDDSFYKSNGNKYFSSMNNVQTRLIKEQSQSFKSWWNWLQTQLPSPSTTSLETSWSMLLDEGSSVLLPSKLAKVFPKSLIFSLFKESSQVQIHTNLVNLLGIKNSISLHESLSNEIVNKILSQFRQISSSDAYSHPFSFVLYTGSTISNLISVAYDIAMKVYASGGDVSTAVDKIADSFITFLQQRVSMGETAFFHLPPWPRIMHSFVSLAKVSVDPIELPKAPLLSKKRFPKSSDEIFDETSILDEEEDEDVSSYIPSHQQSDRKMQVSVFFKKISLDLTKKFASAGMKLANVELQSKSIPVWYDTTYGAWAFLLNAVADSANVPLSIQISLQGPNKVFFRVKNEKVTPCNGDVSLFSLLTLQVDSNIRSKLFQMVLSLPLASIVRGNGLSVSFSPASMYLSVERDQEISPICIARLKFLISSSRIYQSSECISGRVFARTNEDLLELWTALSSQLTSLDTATGMVQENESTSSYSHSSGRFSFVEYGSGLGELSLLMSRAFPLATILSVEDDENLCYDHLAASLRSELLNNVIAKANVNDVTMKKLYDSPEFFRFQLLSKSFPSMLAEAATSYNGLTKLKNMLGTMMALSATTFMQIPSSTLISLAFTIFADVECMSIYDSSLLDDCKYENSRYLLSNHPRPGFVGSESRILSSLLHAPINGGMIKVAIAPIPAPSVLESSLDDIFPPSKPISSIGLASIYSSFLEESITSYDFLINTLAYPYISSGLVRIDLANLTRHVNHHFDSEIDGHNRKYTLKVLSNVSASIDVMNKLTRKTPSENNFQEVYKYLSAGNHPNHGNSISCDKIVCGNSQSTLGVVSIRLQRDFDGASIPYDTVYGITLITIMRLGLLSPLKSLAYHSFLALPLYQDMAPWNIVFMGPKLDYIDYDTRDKTYDKLVPHAYEIMEVLFNYKRTVEDFKKCAAKGSNPYGFPFVSDCVGGHGFTGPCKDSAFPVPCADNTCQSDYVSCLRSLSKRDKVKEFRKEIQWAKKQYFKEQTHENIEQESDTRDEVFDPDTPVRKSTEITSRSAFFAHELVYDDTGIV
jgi:hypothetical protein